MVVSVYVLEVLYSLLIIFLSMHSYGERRETKGKLFGTNGHGFDFVFSSYKDCTGSSPWAKDRVSCGLFSLGCPMVRKMVIHCVLGRFTCFRMHVLSIIKKRGVATVDILVNSRDWMVAGSISAMADDGGNVTSMISMIEDAS